MIPALTLTLILGGAISTQTPWNLQLLHNQNDHRAATWTLAGSAPKAYFVTAEGDSGFRLESDDDASPNDVETAYRAVMAEKFPGKRIRVTLEIRTEGVKGGAGLWIRIDDKTGKPIVLKDMEHDLIVGSKPWTKYELVADVPKDAAQIGYGIVLVGRGEVSFQNVRIEVLDTL